MHIEIREHQGDVDIKSAHVKGMDRFAVKSGPDFQQPGQRTALLAGHDGGDQCETGMPMAVLLDNAYLTDVRTAAAGAVAARHLAPKTVDTAGVIGAGAQGRYQILALRQVRHFRQVKVYDQEPDLMDAYAWKMTRELGVPVIPAGYPAEVIQASQVVVTCTPSRTPFVDPEVSIPDFTSPPLGRTCRKSRNCRQAYLEKPISLPVTSGPRVYSGELYNAEAQGAAVSEDQVIELGEMVSGRHPGRQSDDEITVCDLSGTGGPGHHDRRPGPETGGRKHPGTDRGLVAWTATVI